MKLESVLQYLDEYLEVEDFPDYGSAHNGLQVEGPTEVARVAVAVDASEAVILEAVDQGVDLLIVHHGLFWDGRTRVTGPRFRKLRSLIQGSTALYGCHLPLDAHVQVGNCAVLCRELGWEPAGRFGSYQGRELGWWSEVDSERDALATHVEEVVGGPRSVSFRGGPSTSTGWGWSPVRPRVSFRRPRRLASMPSLQGKGPTTRTTTPWSSG